MAETTVRVLFDADTIAQRDRALAAEIKRRRPNGCS
jgi:hypothetical protein